MKGRWLLVGVSAAALLPVIGLLLVIFWMGFWQSGPGEPVVYTLNNYRNILTDPFTYKTMLNTLGSGSRLGCLVYIVRSLPFRNSMAI